MAAELQNKEKTQNHSDVKKQKHNKNNSKKIKSKAKEITKKVDQTPKISDVTTEKSTITPKPNNSFLSVPKTNPLTTTKLQYSKYFHYFLLKLSNIIEGIYGVIIGDSRLEEGDLLDVDGVVITDENSYNDKKQCIPSYGFTSVFGSDNPCHEFFASKIQPGLQESIDYFNTLVSRKASSDDENCYSIMVDKYMSDLHNGNLKSYRKYVEDGGEQTFEMFVKFCLSSDTFVQFRDYVGNVLNNQDFVQKNLVSQQDNIDFDQYVSAFLTDLYNSYGSNNFTSNYNKSKKSLKKLINLLNKKVHFNFRVLVNSFNTNSENPISSASYNEILKYIKNANYCDFSAFTPFNLKYITLLNTLLKLIDSKDCKSNKQYFIGCLIMMSSLFRLIKSQIMNGQHIIEV